MSLLRTNFRLAKDSIRRHRSRSLLSCLGIAIGVASLILILSLLGSINNLITTSLTKSDDLILIRPSITQTTPDNILSELTSSHQYLNSSLSLADLDAAKSVNNIKYAAPIATYTATVTNVETHEKPSALLLGTTTDFQNIDHPALAKGTFLTEAENSLVIGHTIALQLFGNASPIGKTLTILGEKFIIVGLLAEVSDPISLSNFDLNQTIIMSADRLATLAPSLQVQQINIEVTDPSLIADTTAELTNALKTAKQGDTNFSVLYGDQITHPSSNLITIISGILSLVSSISLVVGGIGVMNIMLVSVSERSHEIGIRKAVGASSLNIFSQFLFESLILCLSGGLLGFIFAYVAAFFICLITPFSPFISWPVLAITFGTGLITGLIFGLYPALKAAHKSPIDSLKSCYN